MKTKPLSDKFSSEHRFSTEAGGRFTLYNNPDHVPPTYLDVNIRFMTKKDTEAGRTRGIHVNKREDGSLRSLDVLLDDDFSARQAESSVQMKALMKVMDRRLAHSGFDGINIRYGEEKTDGSFVKKNMLVNLLTSFSEVAPGMKIHVLCSRKDVMRFSGADALVNGLLADQPAAERAKWATQLIRKFNRGLINETWIRKKGDVALSARSPILMKEDENGIWKSGSDKQVATWADGMLEVLEDDLPKRYETFSRSVWRDLDFEKMTMKTGFNKYIKETDMKVRHLAYMMALGGAPEKLVTKKLKAMSEENPFMKEVLKFTKECALLIRARAEDNNRIPVLRDYPFMPFMNLKDLRTSANWNDFFRNHYEEAVKSGCNFNRLDVWQSVGLLIASRYVDDQSLNILYNDASEAMRAKGRHSPEYLNPAKILMEIMENRTGSTSDKISPHEQEKARMIFSDYIRMCKAQDRKVSLVPKSLTRYKELHDEMAANADLEKLPEIEIQDKTKFADLRALLPPDFEWLTDKKRLYDEGQEMHHCVGGGHYHRDINEDICAIYSVVRDGQRFTIEFNLPGEGGARYGNFDENDQPGDAKFDIRQIQGVSNSHGTGDTWANLRKEVLEYLKDSAKNQVLLSGESCSLPLSGRSFSGSHSPDDELHLTLDSGKDIYRIDQENGELAFNGRKVDMDSAEAKEVMGVVYDKVLRTVVAGAGNNRLREREDGRTDIDLKDWYFKASGKGMGALFKGMDRFLEQGNPKIHQLPSLEGGSL